MKKVYKYFLVVKWKTGNAKILLKRPKNIGSEYVMLPITLDIEIPENIMEEVSASIKVSTQQVKQAMIDEI